MMNAIRIPQIREIHQKPFRGLVVADSSVDEFLRSGAEPGDLVVRKGCIIKSGSMKTRTRLIDLPTSDLGCSGVSVLVKEYFFRNGLHGLKPFLLKPRPTKVWQISWHLLGRGISVPEPFCYLLKRKGLLCTAGYLFSRYIPQCHNLAELLIDPEKRERRLNSGKLIGTLARSIASLHESRVLHGDLKWSNILVHEVEDRVWFVDLDAARQHRRALTPARASRDLADFVFNGLEYGVEESVFNRLIDGYTRFRRFTRREMDKPVEKAVGRLGKRCRQNRAVRIS